MHRRIIGFALAVVLSVSAFSQADTLIYSEIVPIQATNYNTSVSFPLFDPALGTLMSIMFHLTGTVQGLAKFESMDDFPATVTMNLQAQITLQRPDLSALLAVLPVAQTVDNATAFDNVMDFAGTSGKTYPNLSNTTSNMLIVPPPAGDLALFTGVGSISLPFIATDTSNGSGAAELMLDFNTSAGAQVDVMYEYEPIPEPASLALLAIGGLVLTRRRR